MHEKKSPIGPERGAFPLSGLRAFDAAARLGSFRAAADALGVTPSAVSHQIKALEREIASPLFHRRGRDVVLSEAGASLAPYVRQGFLAFDRGTAIVRGRARAGQIRVSALALFSQTILIPNLAKFSERWPDYDVRIEATTRYVDFDRDDVDLAIRYGNGKWPGLECTELLRISGLPVATRAHLTERRLHKPADLVTTRLIHDAAQPRAWSAWLGAQGVSQRDESRDLWFDSAPATLQAAEQNLGVALAIDPLIYRWPGFGKRLVAAFPGLTGPRARYWLARRPESDVDPKIRAFISWVRAACRSFDQPRRSV
ncbi:MAG TPA: LysR substrate-binding domain-containing protein [Bradyrhizobium sp.]|jgi:LysR family glycine cleavage system transcriptional activator|nr:LysR substrate-binding domain-containing protein [Bradyrhizobium sp.]